MPDTTNKPIIFLAFANDRDDSVGYLRNLADEARRLSDVLQPAEQAGLCEVVVKQNSTAGDIFKVFQDSKYRNRIAIFHYGGHANGYQLLLESPEGKAAAADAGGLAAFLAQQQGLQLVFLNGCSTQQQTRELLDANVSAVISTSRAIFDHVATNFASQFYQGLGGGAGLQKAFDEAAAAVETTKGKDTRGLYFDGATKITDSFDADRLPWLLTYRAGAEHVAAWNLPNAVDDPLFGLPSLPEQNLPEQPYRHLNWFSRKDADVFFGRGHQIRELYDRLTAPRAEPIMLFYGQSGVGKSSILDAGLIPRLGSGYEVRYLRRHSLGLLETLRLAFLPEAIDVPIETAWRVKEEQTGKPLIVLLDQLEEIYTQPIAGLPNELEQLLEVVKATFVTSHQRPRGKLILGFRKEWLAELEAQLIAFELPRTKVFLEPLDRRGIIEVVRGPARSKRLQESYGLTVEDGLADIIADDLLGDRDSAIAPTLQILLTKMWNKATEANYEHPEFTRKLYQHLKRDGILLRDFLTQQIAAFHEQYPEAVDSGLLLDIVALHTTPLGTADHRTLEELKQQYAHLGAALPDILQQCQDLHLLTIAASTQKESAKNTRLAHDTLAPLVRERFEVSDKPGQRARRILDNRSVDWEGDEAGTPLDEADLMLVEKGASGTRTLSSTEQRLVQASRELRAKLKRMRMILTIAGAVAVTLIVVAAGVAWWQRGLAKTAEKEAVDAMIVAEDAKKEAVEALVEADANRGRARELMSDMVPKVMAAVDFSVPEEKEELVDASLIYFEKFVTEHAPNGVPNAESLAVLADAEYVIGRLYREQASFALAVQAYEQAAKWQWGKLKGLTTFADLSELKPDYLGTNIEVGDKNEGLVNDFGYTLNELGHTYRDQGDAASKEKQHDEADKYWGKAKDQYTAAATIREKLAKHQREKEPPVDPSKQVDYQRKTIDYQLLQVSAEMNIGLAEIQLKDYPSATTRFTNADETRQALLMEFPADKTITRHIGLGKHNIARQLRKQREIEMALEREDEAIAAYEDLSTADLVIKAELATCYLVRGELKLELLAREEFNRVDRVLEKVDSDGDLKKTYLDELTAAEANAAIDDFVAAAKSFRELYKAKSYVSEYRNRLNDLSYVLIELYQPILEIEKVPLPEQEKPLSEDVVQLLDSLRDFHQSRNSAENISDYYSRLYAELYKKVKGWEGARDQLKLDVEFWKSEREEKHKGSKDERKADELRAELLHLHAEALFELHDGEAEEIKERSLKLWQKLIDESPAEDREFYTEERKKTSGLGPPDGAPVPSEVGGEHKDPVRKDPVGAPDNAPVPSKVGEEPNSPVKDEPLAPPGKATVPSKDGDKP